eukprot:c13753_g1_i1 orf=147-530(-)
MERYASLFCSLCGTLLSFDSDAAAACPLCHSQKDTAGIQDKEFWYRTTSEDLVRRLGIEPLVKPSRRNKHSEEDAEEAPQRAVVNDECPKCHNPQLEYYTRQLRSADEGQTVFYECPNCHHKFAQNM